MLHQCGMLIKIYINAIENVQRRATKQLPNIKALEYPDRLKKLELPTLAYRRVQGDMFETYKILHGVYDRDVADVLTSYRDSAEVGTICTGGHSLKLLKPRPNKTLHQQSFTHHTVPPWNRHPEEAVTTPSLNTFKNTLERHWSCQYSLYNYKATITGS